MNLFNIKNLLQKIVPPSVRSIIIRNRPTASGVVVDCDNVMEIPEVFSCIRVLSESVASLPLDLMIRDGEKSVDKAVDNPIYELLRWQPNSELCSYELRLWMMIDCLVRGNGFAQIIRDGNGIPLEIWPLEASKMIMKRAVDDNRLLYIYRANNKLITFEQDEILHIRCMVTGGLIGLSIVDKQKETLSASRAAGDYSGEFFKNGTVMSGVIEVPTELSEEAYNRMTQDLSDNYSKTGNRHRTPVLEGGTKFQPLVLNHRETQLLETRKYHRSVVAGLLRVPAHLINDLEKATFSNIVEQDIGFVKHGLRPWLTNWEQRTRMSLLTDEEKKNHFFKHNTADLLRGDLSSRFTAYGIAIQNRFMSPNDVRLKEDMNPYEGGDTYIGGSGATISPDEL